MDTTFSRETDDRSSSIDSVIDFYRNENTQFKIDSFLSQVRKFFLSNPKFRKSSPPLVHSIKSRIKDPEHLRDKLSRKLNMNIIITPENLFSEIADLAGVRVLHLYQGQFAEIHTEIAKKVSDGEWKFRENAKAYTWDPDTKAFFENLEIKAEMKETHYTSVHYVVQPNNESTISCEIQVRTLFEEIWGEIDHAINYPHETSNTACREQLRVLSKLVSTGTRLSDSIFKCFTEYSMCNSSID